MINYDWVREDLYGLPASAQIFFRKFIVNNNKTRIPINLENIARELNFIDGNKTIQDAGKPTVRVYAGALGNRRSYRET